MIPFGLVYVPYTMNTTTLEVLTTIGHAAQYRHVPKEITPHVTQKSIEYPGSMHTFSWTRSLKPQNQDAVGVGDNYIAVADGITPLTSGDKEATATARFSSALMRGLAYYGVSPDTLRAGLTLSIHYAQKRRELDEVSSTLTVATWDDRDFRIATMGDCIALVLTTSGWRVVCDPSYADHDERYLAQVHSLVAQGYGRQEAYTELTSEIMQDRRARNTEQGEWIVSGSVDPAEVAGHFHEVTLPREQVKACILLSDGADNWRSLFNLVDEPGLLAASGKDLLEYWEEAVKLQTADAERSSYPRLSDLDDSSLARVDFR